MLTDEQCINKLSKYYNNYRLDSINKDKDKFVTDVSKKYFYIWRFINYDTKENVRLICYRNDDIIVKEFL